MSVDGGVTWNTGITGSGINATYITSGYLNTGAINIMNSGFPSFRWDGIGLNAFQFEVDQNTGEPYGFNVAKFVRFDQYGIYGINGQSEFDPNISQNEKVGEDKIWDEANFALTWKGFMLKNDDGSVRITSTNDIQVMEGEIERIKIGRIVNNEDNAFLSDVYGIRISNSSGATVMETDDQGELWLKNRLSIETSETNTVGIGKLGNPTNELSPGHGERVIDANNKFVVYEDGHTKASSMHIDGDSTFTGQIFATGGQIGNLTIDQVESSVYQVVITSNVGSVVKQGSNVTLTAELLIGGVPVESELSYQWYTPNGDIDGATNKTYEIEGVNFSNAAVLQYGCKITVS